MDSYTFTIITVIGNAEKVQAIISDNGVASVHDLEAHNTDPGAHGGLLQNLKNELATHNTDISSHKAITTMIAKILGATNWQENPVATLKDIKNLLGMGGIVAQRLEENGFVKFANGFTIQWVKTKETAQNDPLPFPITYSTDFIAGVACFNNGPTSYAPWTKINNKASYFAGLSGDWSPYYVNKEITCIFVGI